MLKRLEFSLIYTQKIKIHQMQFPNFIQRCYVINMYKLHPKITNGWMQFLKNSNAQKLHFIHFVIGFFIVYI